MPKMIQLRNVPDALHRKVKSRAAIAGMSLSDCLIFEIKEIADKPTLGEFRERLARREPVELDVDPARMIRKGRDTRRP